MDYRYHRAARDGRLDLLKQAFTKELNQPDDDGMTPTLWSAYHGNLEALALCCKRGGDYDKCDYTGNSCLHLAAQNGHKNCLTFLVKLGANIFALDNDYNTALTVAGNRGQTQCVEYLDSVFSQQKDKKKTKEKKAMKEAEQRIKKYSKLQEKQLKKMEQFYKGTGRKISSQTNPGEMTRKTSSSSAPNFSQSISADVPKSIFMTQKRSETNNFIISNNNRKEAKTLSGLPSAQVSNVMYVQPQEMASLGNNNSAPGRRAPVQNVFPEAVNDEEEAERPMRFGTKALRGNFNSAMAMCSVLGQFDENGFADSGDSVVPSASKPVLKIADDSDSEGSEDDEESEEEVDQIMTFLDSLRLTEYAPLFREEQMDMEALMLCTIQDLKGMGLTLGPRKKIMDAIKTRQAEIDAEFTTF